MATVTNEALDRLTQAKMRLAQPHVAEVEPQLGADVAEVERLYRQPLRRAQADRRLNLPCR
jgi:hypothetical protein